MSLLSKHMESLLDRRERQLKIADSYRKVGLLILAKEHREEADALLNDMIKIGTAIGESAFEIK